MRWFNTAGPCRPEEHYTVLERSGVSELVRLIDRKSYFVLHAPRQTGKTTTLLVLARRLTEEGRYAAAVLSAEVGAPFGDDLERLEPALLGAWAIDASTQLPPELRPPPWPEAPGARVRAALTAWSEHAARPLALVLDEIDALRDDALVTVLRQLRAGFPSRPGHFPHRLALVGLRDVRDYVVAAGAPGGSGPRAPSTSRRRASASSTSPRTRWPRCCGNTPRGRGRSSRRRRWSGSTS